MEKREAMEKRGRARREPQAQKETVKLALSGVPCGLCVSILKDGQVYPMFHNDAFYEVLGYSDEHISEIGKDETGIGLLGVHEEDASVLYEKVKELLQKGTSLSHTCRIFHDKKGIYRWIHMNGSRSFGEDKEVLFYLVISDVSGQVQVEKELVRANENMQDIINAIPGGVAIYKVSDIFETIYFSEGVPELSGYTVEEYRELTKKNAVDMIYREDTEMVVSKAQEVIQNHGVSEFEFRKQHRDGHIVWVHVTPNGSVRRTDVRFFTVYSITSPL